MKIFFNGASIIVKCHSAISRSRIKFSWFISTIRCSRFNEYIKYVEDLISPDLIIFGGGISKYFNEYNSLLKSRSKILPAKLENDAGIIGAALYTSLSLE